MKTLCKLLVALTAYIFYLSGEQLLVKILLHSAEIQHLKETGQLDDTNITF